MQVRKSEMVNERRKNFVKICYSTVDYSVTELHEGTFVLLNHNCV